MNLEMPFPFLFVELPGLIYDKLELGGVHECLIVT